MLAVHVQGSIHSTGGGSWSHVALTAVKRSSMLEAWTLKVCHMGWECGTIATHTASSSLGALLLLKVYFRKHSSLSLSQKTVLEVLQFEGGRTS